MGSLGLLLPDMNLLMFDQMRPSEEPFPAVFARISLISGVIPLVLCEFWDATEKLATVRAAKRFLSRVNPKVLDKIGFSDERLVAIGTSEGLLVCVDLPVAVTL